MNKFIGKVGDISEKKIIQRALKDDIIKIILEVTSDADETVFFEVRDACIKLLETNNIKTGDYIEVRYLFKGSKNGTVQYNNIVVSDIKLILDPKTRAEV